MSHMRQPHKYKSEQCITALRKAAEWVRQGGSEDLPVIRGSLWHWEEGEATQACALGCAGIHLAGSRTMDGLRDVCGSSITRELASGYRHIETGPLLHVPGYFDHGNYECAAQNLDAAADMLEELSSE